MITNRPGDTFEDSAGEVCCDPCLLEKFRGAAQALDNKGAHRHLHLDCLEAKELMSFSRPKVLRSYLTRHYGDLAFPAGETETGLFNCPRPLLRDKNFDIVGNKF
jgi:hypothetical protein